MFKIAFIEPVDFFAPQNLKKSWHPTTFKNQKRVWEAEQADKAEKQKLAELQREIQHERNFEDLKKIGQSSGVLAADNNKGKLEWMYKASGSSLNREEYLTGRAVDKHFEDQDAVEKKKQKANLVGVTAPINHVEHECIPFSIRAFKAAPDVSALFHRSKYFIVLFKKLGLLIVLFNFFLERRSSGHAAKNDGRSIDGY